MPKPTNITLYNKAKELADEVYKKPSAYKSGFIVEKYKEMGGKYESDNEPKKFKTVVQRKMEGHRT